MFNGSDHTNLGLFPKTYWECLKKSVPIENISKPKYQYTHITITGNRPYRGKLKKKSKFKTKRLNVKGIINVPFGNNQIDLIFVNNREIMIYNHKIEENNKIAIRNVTQFLDNIVKTKLSEKGMNGLKNDITSEYNRIIEDYDLEISLYHDPIIKKNLKKDLVECIDRAVRVKQYFIRFNIDFIQALKCTNNNVISDDMDYYIHYYRSLSYNRINF